jgi:hypothetical protein
MSSNAQIVTLLRQNKAEQVSALQALGFDVTEDVRASEFPKYIKWAAGLLDVMIAANRISDGSKWFFTVDEWNSLTYENKSKFITRGVRVRADRLSFIIAPEGCTGTIQWGTKTDVSGLQNYNGTAGLYDDVAARSNTEKIVNALGEENGTSAAFCLNYRCFGADDGLEDKTEWALPTVAHLKTMYRYKTEINAAFKALSEDFVLSSTVHWSSCEYDTNSAWAVEINSGRVYTSTKTDLKKVRPISVE